MRTLILALVAVVALMALLPRAADADDQDVARAHFVTGRSYYEQKRYAEALNEFQEAYRLSKRAGFLYNIAVCHEQLGDLDAAQSAFERYLVSVKDASERAEVEARIEHIQARRAAARSGGEPAGAGAPGHAATRPAGNGSGGGAVLTSSAPPQRAERPLYKRGWFWGVMVGAAAVVVTGVTVGVVVGTADRGPRTLPDVMLQ
jgi:tetratricopeptide (TPR) repeat protein